MASIEYRQWGLILVVLGTLLMGISVRYKPGMGRDIQREIGRRNDLIVPTEVIFSPLWFWFGLACVGLGTLFQW